MPVSGGKYVAPAWKDNAPPALDAAELQAMTDAIERTEASIGDVTTPAQKMGLTGDLSIGKSLGVLADVGNVHVWRRTVSGAVDFLTSINPNAYQEGNDEKPAGYVLGDVVTGSFALCQTYDASMVWDYSDNLVVSENGDISMGTTTRLSLSRNNAVSDAEVLKGKFFISRMSGFPGFEDGKIYYMPADATITKNVALYTNMYQIPAGYPAIPANTIIEYLGSLGDKARIEIGSYVGTGTDTSAVTISFKPSLVFLFGASNTMYAPIGKNSGTFSINYQYAGSSHGERSGTIKVNDNVVTVYYPFNDSGATYTIVAFK